MVNRRAFLKAIAATAIAVPLAPLIPKYATGGVITAPAPLMAMDLSGLTPAAAVHKISAWIPVTYETLEDGRMIAALMEKCTVMEGALGARPAAGLGGRLYVTTDEPGGRRAYRDADSA